MNRAPRRPLAIGPLRAFEAVARRLGFSAAAEELSLTQSAVSRQIRSLEEELGSPLFVRGTRHVELTPAGTLLLRNVVPLLQRLDGTVRQIRSARGRRHVVVNTFASFASLWLLPRLASFQLAHPDIDIRITAEDALIASDDPDTDLLLRYCRPDVAPAGAVRLFGEVLTPVIGRALRAQIVDGKAPPLARPADLSRHTLLDDDTSLGGDPYVSWRRWFQGQGMVAGFEPARWIYVNYTYQQVQAALAGQGIALARLAMVAESIVREELLEPFGVEGRSTSPRVYWLVHGQDEAPRPEVQAFARWVLEEAAQTRTLIGEHEAVATLKAEPQRAVRDRQS